jgi:hypothetical protein
VVFLYLSFSLMMEQQRTSWLHQLGRHSPHFGVDTEVVVPIPKPSGFSDDDAYKM